MDLNRGDIEMLGNTVADAIDRAAERIALALERLALERKPDPPTTWTQALHRAAMDQTPEDRVRLARCLLDGTSSKEVPR